jgi:hypothetical protein
VTATLVTDGLTISGLDTWIQATLTAGWRR